MLLRAYNYQRVCNYFPDLGLSDLLHWVLSNEAPPPALDALIMDKAIQRRPYKCFLKELILKVIIDSKYNLAPVWLKKRILFYNYLEPIDQYTFSVTVTAPFFPEYSRQERLKGRQYVINAVPFITISKRPVKSQTLYLKSLITTSLSVSLILFKKQIIAYIYSRTLIYDTRVSFKTNMEFIELFNGEMLIKSTLYCLQRDLIRRSYKNKVRAIYLLASIAIFIVNLIGSYFSKSLHKGVLVEFRKKGLYLKGHPIYSKSFSVLPLCSVVLLNLKVIEQLSYESIISSFFGPIMVGPRSKKFKGFIKKWLEINDQFICNFYIFLYLICISFLSILKHILNTVRKNLNNRRAIKNILIARRLLRFLRTVLLLLLKWMKWITLLIIFYLQIINIIIDYIYINLKKMINNCESLFWKGATIINLKLIPYHRKKVLVRLFYSIVNKNILIKKRTGFTNFRYKVNKVFYKVSVSRVILSTTSLCFRESINSIYVLLNTYRRMCESIGRWRSIKPRSLGIPMSSQSHYFFAVNLSNCSIPPIMVSLICDYFDKIVLD